MNKKEVVFLLEEIAKKDIATGSDIYDHPCTVAVRAINRYQEDILALRRISTGRQRGKSKAIQELCLGVYCQDF